MQMDCMKLVPGSGTLYLNRIFEEAIAEPGYVLNFDEEITLEVKEGHKHNWGHIWSIARKTKEESAIRKTLPKAQQTRGLRSYHKFKNKSWSNSIFRILTKHQLQNLNQSSAFP